MKRKLKSGEWLVKAGKQIVYCKTEAEADIVLEMAKEGPPVGAICALIVVGCLAFGYFLGGM